MLVNEKLIFLQASLKDLCKEKNVLYLFRSSGYLIF
jgi:hypothetical protein